MHSIVNASEPRKRPVRLMVALMLPSVLSGCYYLQAARGQLDLMSRREPIDEILRDADRPAELRRNLALIREARRFSITELALPDNDSYLSYAELDREYVVWNVFAAGEFTTEPETWCFPVAGCVAYRGYFSEQAARREARKLAGRGLDVHVAGVSAYSTLGRFDDPVLSTMLRWSELRLVETLFHELAHQQLYVQDDTEFNESFATVVARAGLQRWLRARGAEAELAELERRDVWRRGWLAEVATARARLQALYGSGRDAEAMRGEKSRIFDELAASPLAPADPPANNAALVPLAAYHGLTEELAALLESCGGRLPCFYAEAAALAGIDAGQRRARLAAYLPAERR